MLPSLAALKGPPSYLQHHVEMNQVLAVCLLTAFQLHQSKLTWTPILLLFSDPFFQSRRRRHPANQS